MILSPHVPHKHHNNNNNNCNYGNAGVTHVRSSRLWFTDGFLCFYTCVCVCVCVCVCMCVCVCVRACVRLIMSKNKIEFLQLQNRSHNNRNTTYCDNVNRKLVKNWSGLAWHDDTQTWIRNTCLGCTGQGQTCKQYAGSLNTSLFHLTVLELKWRLMSELCCSEGHCLCLPAEEFQELQSIRHTLLTGGLLGPAPKVNGKRSHKTAASQWSIATASFIFTRFLIH